MSALDSHNNLMANASAYGMVQRAICPSITAVTTAATTSSGYVSMQRYPVTWNFLGRTGTATVAAGVTGGYITYCRMLSSAPLTSLILGVEYGLGTLTGNGSTGTFADGVAMPTKNYRIEGVSSSIQTGAMCCYAAITTVLPATAGNLSITYTNQAGTTSQTMTMVIPASSAINSAFDLIPHLASGDTGIRDITAMSFTAGGQPASGVVAIKGVLPVATAICGVYPRMNSADPLAANLPMTLIEPSDLLALYSANNLTANRVVVVYGCVAEA